MLCLLSIAKEPNVAIYFRLELCAPERWQRVEDDRASSGVEVLEEDLHLRRRFLFGERGA